jgi:hypothetical protein
VTRGLYIVKNNGLNLYIWRDGNIYRNNEIIYTDVREKFTVTVGNDKNEYVFVQNGEGNVFLNNKEILHNVSDKIYDVCFNAFFEDGKTVLFYTVNNMIMMQTRTENSWSKAVKIDEKAELLSVFKASGKNIVFYNKRGNENKTGYRIIDSAVGEYKVFYKTLYRITDSSAVFFEDTAHCVCIIKNMFSSNLVYRGNMGIIPICNSSELSKCCIFGTKERVCIIWEENGRLYSTIGENGRFSGRKKLASGSFEKAKIIGVIDKKMCISELFVDKMKGFEIVDVDNLREYL